MPMHYGHGGKKKPASKTAGKKMSPKQKALAKKGYSLSLTLFK